MYKNKKIKMKVEFDVNSEKKDQAHGRTHCQTVIECWINHLQPLSRTQKFQCNH